MTDRTEPKVDAGVLLLRLGAGLSMALLFGIPKLKDAWLYVHAGHSWPFIDFNRRLGVPMPVLVAYVQSINESIGALLVACGLLTRWAAALLFIGFAAATGYSFKAHESVLLPGLYCLMFATIALTGPGKLSLDRLLSGRTAKSQTR